jgi:hypothetical protein
MANITKTYCDRCNKKIEYGFIAKYDLQKKQLRLINNSCYIKVDLCKECQSELEKWFEMKKGE